MLKQDASRDSRLGFHGTRLDNREDLMRVRQLFDDNGFTRSAEDIEWIYRGLEGEMPYATLAMDGAVPAGLYATVPARFRIHGEEVLAAQSLDTMVDRRYRGFGLFTKLARSTYAEMADGGVTVVYGFPNGNSNPGFLSKLGWTSLDPVPFLFRPMNVGYVAAKFRPVLRRLLPFRIPVWGARAQSESLADLPPAADLDALWSRFSSQLIVARVRDSSFLAQRYARHPRARYFYRGCYEQGELVGLSVHCIEEKHGGRIGYLMELICLPHRDDVARKLVNDVLHDMRKAACDGALAWCFEHSPHYRVLLRRLFLPLPVALRPIELHFAYMELGDAARELANRRHWYISYGDSDTV